jgi:hypothetical protein
VFVSLLFVEIKQCVLSPWVFQSHHQWFLPPTIGIRASFVTKHKFFGRYPNFQSCQKHVLIIPPCRDHPYELTDARISLIGAAVIYTRHLKILHCWTTRSHAPRGWRRVTSTRAIFEPFTPGQAEPLAAPKNIPENIPC